MPTDHAHIQMPATLEQSPPVVWLTNPVGTDRTEFRVSLDLDGSTLRIARQWTCGDTPASRIVVWSRDHAEVCNAEAAYEALGAHQAGCSSGASGRWHSDRTG